jgi:gamma-glutamyltranspeptidase/glutathione hydrolase
MEFHSRRSPVLSLRGLCAASQPLASQAGIQVLTAGGTAVDAAVAVAATLAVTEPCSTGIGGDALLLYFDAKEKKVSALLGCGRSPAALTLEAVQRAGLKELAPASPLTVTVPGAPALWCDAIDRFSSGSVPIRSVLDPAIQLAEFGFPVSPLTALQWRSSVDLLKRSPGGSALLVERCRAPRAGEVFRNPGLGRALRLIAERGKAGFYEGPVADAIVSSLASVPMLHEDLRSHRTEEAEPLQAEYRGVRIYEMPPPTQGLATLIALKILDGIDLESLHTAGQDAALLDALIRAMRVGFLVADTYIADRSHAPDSCRCCGQVDCGAVCRLFTDDSMRTWRRIFREGRAQLSQQSSSAAGFPGSDTVQFCVVDEQGNACSFVNSTCKGFGTGIVPEGFGFSLQNRGLGFSLDSRSPNVLGPCRRPYHTLMPGMAVHASSGCLFSAFGVMGGMMQPQGHLQVIVNMMDRKMDAQAALDAPRFFIESRNFRPENIAHAPLLLEQGILPHVASELQHLGHPIKMSDVQGPARMAFGRGQVIMRDADAGVFWGGSDPRADGCAIAQV